MIERKYQVFISSTFSDLVQERRSVSEALLRQSCFPAGMELFPAADMEQFEFIKNVIDQSDFYLVILAGRYGSISPDTNLSYTEMEFDYALQKNKPIIRLVHRDPLSLLPKDKVDESDKAKSMLMRFRAKLRSNRLCKEWDNADELKFETIMGLQDAISRNVLPGWIRGGNQQEKLLQAHEKIRQLEVEMEELRRGTDGDFTQLKKLAVLLSNSNRMLDHWRLIEIASEHLLGKVVFIDIFKSLLAKDGFNNREAEAVVSAFVLDGLVKRRTNGELALLEPGKAAFEHAKFGMIGQMTS